MDITTTGAVDPAAGMPEDIDALVASLDEVDPAEAPEIATEIARRLTNALEAVPHAAAEQLSAFAGDETAEG